MGKKLLLILLVFVPIFSFSQSKALDLFLSDSALQHASLSMIFSDAKSGEIIMEHNSDLSLTPASLLKLITSAAALELLGPQYTFKTELAYTGSLNDRTGKLDGDIVIIGGGDPVLGSEHFAEHYENFIDKWVSDIKKTGIKRIEGRVITDDSRYDYQPVPAKWLWEDTGNYYGAGVFGLSVFDNTYEIHLKSTTDTGGVIITRIYPEECRRELSNWLVAAGTSDQGYIFSAPYSTNGWMAGTIPANTDDFVLKASISDPPRLIAEMLNEKLEKGGITVSGQPTTFRLEQKLANEENIIISEIVSPALTEIIEVLNHESINMYAEHLVKELGKVFRDDGSTATGCKILYEFLENAGINTEGLFIEDGSGISPLNALTCNGLTDLLFFMKTGSKYFHEFYNSLPWAGKEGTLKSYFRDELFESNLRAKSGSLTRVKNYAGYFDTQSGRSIVFAIIVNNFNGTSRHIVNGIEDILKEFIVNN